MFRDKKITIALIVILLISVIGLGIAFAAFSQTLTINGSGTVESSSWSVVFEGADGSNTIGAPTLTGTATEVTHPTIKNNSTEISNYEVTLKTPGDSVTYNFKIHNKGDYAANLTSLTVAGVNRPAEPVSYTNLVKNKSDNPPACLGAMNYSFYYTSDNLSVGQYPGRDCLEPGESEEVTLKIIFNEYDYPQEVLDYYEKYRNGYLPKTDLVLDNLGISATYTQKNNGSCQWSPSGAIENAPFVNYEFAYYTYEGNLFMGTGVNNIIISDIVLDRVIYNDNIAKELAENYCTGCRLMTKAEAQSLGCTTVSFSTSRSKCMAKYNNDYSGWWLADKKDASNVWIISGAGTLKSDGDPTLPSGVRPVTDIPSTATMSGSGTSSDPYVISTN